MADLELSVTTTDRIVLLAHSQYRFLQLALARRLRSRFGAELFLYCQTKEDASFWRQHNDDATFSEIIREQSLYDVARQPVSDPEAVFRRGRALERWLGTTINELVMTDRHLGRGFSLAGFNHPRSHISERTSYTQVVAAFSARIEFWRDEFERRKPTLLIGFAKVPAMIARRAGVPCRGMVGSRYKNYYQWVENEFFENSALTRAFETTSDEAEVDLSVPYHSHMVLRNQFRKQVNLFLTARKIGKHALRRAYWRLRRYEKAKGYLAVNELRYLWRQRRDLLRLRRLSVPLSSLKGKPFVYYPLHTEPELSVHGLSPEYFTQMSCIATVARDLPAGVVLAVKETFAGIGRRPAEFYRQIDEFKNVVLVDTLELGLDVVKEAAAVATITGTGGFEAAILGKPVISFGRHNQYGILEHVHVVEDERHLKEKLADAVETRSRRRENRERQGRRFLAALLRVSFDLEGYHFTDVQSYEDRAVDAALEALLASLDLAPDEVSRQATHS